MNRTIPVAVLSIGAGAFLIGAVMAARTTISLVTRGRPAVGVVQSYEQGDRSDSDQPPAWYPVIEFLTSDGQAHRFSSNVGSRPDGIGQRVAVLYDPDMPSRARIDSFRALWLGPALSGGVGLLLLVGLVAFLRLRTSPDEPAWQPQ